MIKVNVYKQSNYPIKATKIKAVVQLVLEKNGIMSDSTVEVALVGRKKIAELAMSYVGESEQVAGEHPVLAFPDSEIDQPFIYQPGHDLYLGEIIIGYPKAVETANTSGKLVEQVVLELAEHGALHLAGIHHD